MPRGGINGYGSVHGLLRMHTDTFHGYGIQTRSKDTAHGNIPRSMETTYGNGPGQDNMWVQGMMEGMKKK